MLQDVYEKYRSVHEGEVTTYIPGCGVRTLVRKMELAAGRPLRIDEAVLASEAATGNRNRAIAYLMLNFGIIDEGVTETLHQYFSQCSLRVNPTIWP